MSGQATQQQILEFYKRPAAMTGGGSHAQQLDALPRGVPALVGVVQGLLLHEHWAPRYGSALSDERRHEAHIRAVASMLDRLMRHDDRPLSIARPVETRLIGICRHFAVLLVSMLRAQGVPARARCGFGSYFRAGCLEDHWVCECWNEAEARWVLVDAQIDALQRVVLKPDFDPLDVPRDRFITASKAWAQCRRGEVDPSAFGIFAMRGLWFIAGNLIRDVAALNSMEMLPWDVWGGMVRPDDLLEDDRFALFDRLASLTRMPDAAFSEVRELYDRDDRLRVPATVFNAVLRRPEPIRARI